MKKLIIVLAAITAIGCGGSTVTPVVPGSTPVNTIQANAQKAADTFNTVGQGLILAVQLAQTIPTLPPATLAAIKDAERYYSCGLLDTTSTATMPPGTTYNGVAIATVVQSCQAHGAPMLGIIKLLGTAGTATSVSQLTQQGLALADKELAVLSNSGNPSIAAFATAATLALSVIRSF